MLFDWLFPQKYERFEIESNGESLRRNTRNGMIQAFSPELGKWCDLDYLTGTNYDGGEWLQMKYLGLK